MQIERNANAVIQRSIELKQYWSGTRDLAMQRWYRMIEMVDELKTDKMESFVGNDPRALYNLVLHLLDAKIPHRIMDYDMDDLNSVKAVSEVSRFFDMSWKDAQDSFRRSNPRQSLMRTFIGFMLCTGWYCMFSMVSDDGKRVYKEPWNPMDVYPMWSAFTGLDEVAHIFTMPVRHAKAMVGSNGWQMDWSTYDTKVTVYDYWWTELDWYGKSIWNAVVIENQLVKFEITRFKAMPIYIAPVGGLPDMGSLTTGLSSSNITVLSAPGSGGYPTQPSDRWKAEIGQAIIATNENVYRTWNKWWTFSLQLLRDTAQPRIFERSRSGKQIVRPEDVFKRGAIFRGGPDDAVEFIGTPPIPLELRSTQLDLEAMMQRGGVSWAMHGTLQGSVSAYVMSQISSSANQIMKPFHQAVVDALSDMDNDDLADIKARGIHPYDWKYPPNLPENARVSAHYEVEVPGELVQKATTARMLDPDFRLSYGYVMTKLFPEISDPMRERAMIRADQAEMHPTNALIALITYYRQQSAFLRKQGDVDSALLYDMAEQAATALLQPQQPQPTGGAAPGMGRPEAVPPLPTGQQLTAGELGG